MKVSAYLGLALCLIGMGYGYLIWSVYLKDTDAAHTKEIYNYTPDLKIIELQDGFFVLQGAGGNITVSTGSDGTLLVDSGDIDMTASVLDALETINATDVTYVINTHSHGDHRGGNATFRRMGAEIIAHRNAYEAIRTDSFTLSKPEDLPTVVFDTTYTFAFNGQDITLTHIPLAHTKGDIIVQFEQADILAAGDAVILESLPFISVGGGAGLDSHLAGISQVMTHINTTTKVVPGQGSVVVGRAGVQGAYDHLKYIRDYMAWLKSKGVSRRYIILFHPLHDWPAEWRKGNGWEKFWVRLAYHTLPSASR